MEANSVSTDGQWNESNAVTEAQNSVESKEPQTNDGNTVSQTNGDSATKRADDLTVKLFIGQLPKTMGEEELKKLFSPYANNRVYRDRTTGQHKGCAFVTYSSKDEADNAINALHNKQTFPPAKNPLQVKYAEGELEKFEHKLFVGMVPKTATEEDLRKVFEPYGEIEEITILRGPGNVSRGCAFVKFKTKESATAAMTGAHGFKMQGSTTQGLNIQPADSDKAKKKAAKKVAPVSYLPPTPYAAYPTPYAPQSYYPPTQTPYAYQPYQAPAYTQPNYQPPTHLTTQPSYQPPRVLSQPSSAYSSAYAYPQVTAAPRPAVSAEPQIEGPVGGNLFIYNVPPHYTDQDLASAFAQFGNLLSAKVYIDKATGMSKGFGFVSYDSPEAAQTAITNMNGVQIAGKRLKVQLKRGTGTTTRANPY